MRFAPPCIFALALIGCSSRETDRSSLGLSAETSAESGTSSSGGGCTYTQGYWKNHASAWPVASLTIGGVVYGEQQLIALFQTAPKGDASLILAHQLIAALLNVANGAVPSASVQQAIHEALAWMAANRGSNVALPYGVSPGSAPGTQGAALSDALDSFNSGGAGTQHCGEGGGGSSSGSSSGGPGSGSSSGGGSSSGSSSGSSGPLQ